MSEAKWKMPLSIQHDRGMVIWDIDNLTVVSHAVTEDDAREIVRRCNSHDDLLAACEAMIEMADTWDRHFREYAKASRWTDSDPDIMAQARAAVAKAKGGQL